MFERDADVRAWALEMWANKIETGSTNHSAEEHRAWFGRGAAMVLDLHKREHIARLRRLAAEERDAGMVALSDAVAAA